MFSNEAELTNACEGVAELCCGKAMVVEMVRRARLAFEDSAVGVVRCVECATTQYILECPCSCASSEVYSVHEATSPLSAFETPLTH